MSNKINLDHGINLDPNDQPTGQLVFDLRRSAHEIWSQPVPSTITYITSKSSAVNQLIHEALMTSKFNDCRSFAQKLKQHRLASVYAMPGDDKISIATPTLSTMDIFARLEIHSNMATKMIYTSPSLCPNCNQKLPK